MSTTTETPVDGTQFMTFHDLAYDAAKTDFQRKAEVIGVGREGELLEVAMGPQHPSTHGVFRMDVVLDGETIVKLKPVFGYLHRNHEKIAENTSYLASMPYTDRLDYFCSLTNNWAYALSVEKLAGLQVPERAEYIRLITAELTRLLNHTCLAGFLLQDMGALGTPLMYAFREREKIQDIWDVLTGVRFTTSFTRIGGLAQDMTPECEKMVTAFLDQFAENLDECERILVRNRIFVERCDGIGAITREQALAYGITGPLLRACGVDHDLRRDEPYLVYDELDFHVPVYDDCDVLARFYVRMQEMKESVKILRQCLQKMPQGPVNAAEPKRVLPKKERTYGKMEELIHDFMLINFGINPPVGEAYHAIEASKGELGFYLVSNGEGHPWRLKIRSPSFVNLQPLPLMMKGGMISDVVAIIGSVDPVMGEADK